MVLRDCSVLDVASGALATAQTVVLHRSKILRVSQNDHAEYPPDSIVIDLKGAVVMPGKHGCADASSCRRPNADLVLMHHAIGRIAN